MRNPAEHLPPALLLAAFGLLVARPEWTSVAALSVAALLVGVRALLGSRADDERVRLLEQRLAQAADLRVADMARLAKAEKDVETALSGVRDVRERVEGRRPKVGL